MALDFTTALLDPRVTVTRALNTATRINSIGSIEVVNADLPRFDYALNTGGACKGLLIEESRVNIIRNWSDFTAVANWTAGSAGGGSAPTNTGNTTTAPDGTSGAQIWQFVAPVSGDRSFLSQTVSGLATGFWSASSFIKAGRPEDIGKIISIKETQGATYTLVTLTDQWQRPESINTSAVTTHGMAFELRPSVGTSTGTVQVAIWGAQTEAGAFVTSAIPNATSGSVTRNADVVSMTGTNFSSWYPSAPFTLAAKYLINTSGNAVADRNVAYFDNGANGNRIFMMAAYGGSSNLAPRCFDDGTLDCFATAGSSNNSFVFAYATNNAGLSVNAGNVVADTSGTAITGQIRLALGANALGANNLNGHLQEINVYPQRLINPELQAFSKG
jgi:hypothetical protein